MSEKRIHRLAGELAVLGLLANAAARGAEPVLTQAGASGSAGAALATVPAVETPLSEARKIALLRQRVKYVFVLFQENRSFDHYFGTYPGADGLVATFPGAVTSVPANRVGSYRQTIRFVDGSYRTVSPFLAPRMIKDQAGGIVRLYPEDFYSVDHSHVGYMVDLHPDAATVSVAKNDGYALAQEGLEYLGDGSSVAGNIVKSGATIPPANVPPTVLPSLQAYQKGLAALAHLDCDTIPFLWHYADVGTLFDNLHQTIIGPSTPNAIAMIAAQTGATQWALHPGTGAAYTLPNETDTAPFAGSAADTYSGKPPFGPDVAVSGVCAVKGAGSAAGMLDNLDCPAPGIGDAARGLYSASALVALKGAVAAYAAPQVNLTFASLPLSFMGAQIASIAQQDAHPQTDLADVQQDIAAIAGHAASVKWGWYQQGFGPEPFDGRATIDLFPASTPHGSYIVHHNGPQYFGYLGDNPAELANMHGLQQFAADVAGHKLPDAGGVFYVRGGYYNNDGLETADPSPAVRATFAGNDDHGSYSDSQISEALIADTVNAIAASPYWSQSAIIISYDESDGFYDHAPEAIRNWGPDGLPMSGGPRIPTIVISPYGAAHTVSHVYDEHGSIIKFINELFGLTPLSKLPDEAHARELGATEPALNSRNGPQTALAPDDGNGVGDLLEAFDNDRLLGGKKLLPASAVTIPRAVVLSLPHYGGAGCSALNITPTDYMNGYGAGLESDPPPAYFNPRPTASPGIPFVEQTIIAGRVSKPWTP